MKFRVIRQSELEPPHAHADKVLVRPRPQWGPPGEIHLFVANSSYWTIEIDTLAGLIDFQEEVDYPLLIRATHDDPRTEIVICDAPYPWGDD